MTDGDPWSSANGWTSEYATRSSYRYDFVRGRSGTVSLVAAALGRPTGPLSQLLSPRLPAFRMMVWSLKDTNGARSCRRQSTRPNGTRWSDATAGPPTVPTKSVVGLLASPESNSSDRASVAALLRLRTAQDAGQVVGVIWPRWGTSPCTMVFGADNCVLEPRPLRTPLPHRCRQRECCQHSEAKDQIVRVSGARMYLWALTR